MVKYFSTIAESGYAIIKKKKMPDKLILVYSCLDAQQRLKLVFDKWKWQYEEFIRNLANTGYNATRFFVFGYRCLQDDCVAYPELTYAEKYQFIADVCRKYNVMPIVSLFYDFEGDTPFFIYDNIDRCKSIIDSMIQIFGINNIYELGNELGCWGGSKEYEMTANGWTKFRNWVKACGEYLQSKGCNQILFSTGGNPLNYLVIKDVLSPEYQEGSGKAGNPNIKTWQFSDCIFHVCYPW